MHLRCQYWHCVSCYGFRLVIYFMPDALVAVLVHRTNGIRIAFHLCCGRRIAFRFWPHMTTAGSISFVLGICLWNGKLLGKRQIDKMQSSV
ncbi:hypothetical protein V1520DRAFT_14487 [Lipomyces starkeyi]